MIAKVRTSGTFTDTMLSPNLIDPDTNVEATGEFAEWDWVMMYRLEEGKIVEEWWFWNRDFIDLHMPQ